MKEAVFVTMAAFPPEIISLILQLMGEDFGRERQNFRLVCRSWDYLISHTSLLWKYIFIDKHSINGPADSKDAFSGTCMALERSGNTHPIYITITLPDEGDNDIHSSRFTVEHATLLSSVISSHSGRIASLCVQGSSHAHHLAALRNTFQLPMPLLRSATFIRDDGLLPPGSDEFYSYDLSDDPNPYPSILQCPHSQNATVVDAWGQEHYPALEKLQIVGVPFDYSRFPALNLTELRLEGREWEELEDGDDNDKKIVRLIRLARKTLEDIKIVDFPLEDAEGYADADLIYLPKLRSLSVGYRNASDVVDFLQCLIFSGRNMTELSLTNTNVLASLDANVAPSELEEIMAEAKIDDQLMIEELIASGFIVHIEKLTLNCVVFHGNPIKIAPSTILREDVNRRVDEPLALAFIQMLPSLKHLNVRDPTGTFLYFMNYTAAYQSSAPYVRLSLHTLETCRAYMSDRSLATAFLAYRQSLQPVPELELEGLDGTLPASKDWPQFKRMARSDRQEEVWDMTDEWSDVAAKLPLTFEEEDEDNLV